MKHQYFYVPPADANKHLQCILPLPFFRALIKQCVLLQRCLSLQSATFYKSYGMCTVFCAYPSTGHALLQGMCKCVTSKLKKMTSNMGKNMTSDMSRNMTSDMTSDMTSYFGEKNSYSLWGYRLLWGSNLIAQIWGSYLRFFLISGPWGNPVNNCSFNRHEPMRKMTIF